MAWQRWLVAIILYWCLTNPLPLSFFSLSFSLSETKGTSGHHTTLITYKPSPSLSHSLSTSPLSFSLLLPLPRQSQRWLVAIILLHCCLIKQPNHKPVPPSVGLPQSVKPFMTVTHFNPWRMTLFGLSRFWNGVISDYETKPIQNTSQRSPFEARWQL